MTPVIPFFIVGFMATLTIALSQAMTSHPDPKDMTPPKPLNAILVGGLGWSALIMTVVNSMVHFGLLIPILSGIALFAAYRIISNTNLTRIYRHSIVLGLLTIIATILVASQHFTARSIS